MHELGRTPGHVHKTHLVGHDITKQHDVSRVDAHTVTLHGVVDLVDDRLPCSFDTKHLRDFDDVVGRGVLSDDACSRVSGWLRDVPGSDAP